MGVLEIYETVCLSQLSGGISNDFCFPSYIMIMLIVIELLFYYFFGLGLITLYRKIKKRKQEKRELKRKKSRWD